MAILENLKTALVLYTEQGAFTLPQFTNKLYGTYIPNICFTSVFFFKLHSNY